MRIVESNIREDGVLEEWFVDDETETLTIKKTQNVDGIASENNDLSELWKDKKQEFKLAARIPVTVYHQILKEAGHNPLIHTHADEMAMLRAAMDDPKYAYLRVWRGRLGRV